jgi:hypothetical protein
MFRLDLLDDAVHAVALRRVQDATVAEPERDVRRVCFAGLGIGNEVSGPHVGLVYLCACILLLIRVARDETPDRAM